MSCISGTSQRPLSTQEYSISTVFDNGASPELRQAAIIDGFQYRPVLDLYSNEALQTQCCQFKGPPSPIAHTQGSIVEFVPNNGFVLVQFQNLRPAPGELSLLQRSFDPFSPPVGITNVARKHSGQGAPRRSDSDSRTELFHKRRQRCVVGPKAPADAELPSRLPGGIREDFDVGGQVEEAGDEFALVRCTVDDDPYPIDSSLRSEFWQGGSDLLHVLDRVEISRMGPEDHHGSLVGDSGKLRAKIHRRGIGIISSALANDFRRRKSHE
mmetsp:Transcript_40386/g.66138  ORF Transcript_40386/g.66138 Transcript_40386/m.66138 type:complete len:269 (-) Transcript_40386:145-951(-)